MHQPINADPANNHGYLRSESGKMGYYHVSTLRAWERAGVARQVAFNIWESVTPPPAYQQLEAVRSILIRIANNTAYALADRVRFLRASHRDSAFNDIFSTCMGVAEREVESLKDVFGDIEFVTDQCDLLKSYGWMLGDN